MAFDDKPLADINEGDIRDLIQAGRAEGPTLEYKSDLYETNDRGNREFLQDVCMFANANGGTILIGIPELRDDANQPTGVPDPVSEIGVELPNPEQQLLAYESRILEGIDERLSVQLRALRCATGRIVIAVRVPNSLAKPHRVRYRGQVNLPSRRERQRYELDAREIKDLAMRTASQFERAESEVRTALAGPEYPSDSAVVLIVAVLPVFFGNFRVDLRNEALVSALGRFRVFANMPVATRPSYTTAGLTIRGPNRTALTLGHNGLLKLNAPFRGVADGGSVFFFPRGIDIFTRQFVVQAAPIFEVGGLSLPALLGISVSTTSNLIISYDELDRLDSVLYEHREYSFPLLPLTSLGAAADSEVRVLLDHIHQGFGQPGSPSFDAVGQWQERR
jgi:Putative DNA-binding domain